MRKLLYAATTLFWLAMWAAVIRTEIQPKDASLLEVPISHIAKLMYRHQQVSTLEIHGENLYQSGIQISSFALTPHVNEKTGENSLEAQLGLNVKMPAASDQNWRANLKFTSDRELTPQLISAEVYFRTFGVKGPENLHFSLQIDPKSETASYSLNVLGEEVGRQVIPLTEKGILAAAQQVGIDTSMFKAIKQSKASTPEIKAYRTRVDIRGDIVTAYLVRATYNEQTLFEARISELGQILDATTLIGWTMKSD